MNSKALSEEALALHRSGRLAEAEALYRTALAAEPNDFTARHLLGVLRAQQGRHAEALAEITAALALRPGDADALLNRANVLRSLGRTDEALAGFDAALAARPHWPQALTGRGLALMALGRLDEALSAQDAALAAAPGHAEALNNRGLVLQEMKRPAEALAAYDQALRAAPRFATAFNNRGSALLDLKRYGDALACFDQALGLRPEDAEIHSNRGNALLGLLRLEEAVASYDRALALRPDFAEALHNRGGALQEFKRHGEALASYDAALAQPGQPHAFGGAAMAALSLNDWSRTEAIAAQMRQRIQAGEAVPPWSVTGYSGDAMLQLQAARNVIASRFPRLPPPLAGAACRHDRVRLGYISSDFGHHPVTAQLVELIERHDRTRFEVIGFSTGADDGSPQRRRIAAAFAQFHDLRGQDPVAAARAIRDLEVDVLVDLNGHTEGDNFDILCHRPAPVQAGWLGYAGTTGAPFMDHIIADRIVAPNPAEFSEKIAALPHCFFPSDTSRAFAPRPSRAAMGLPENAIVFCCFNNNWKITAPVFALWMRLLQQRPGSVLWLKQAGDAAKANLARAAQDHGIDPARLVFARPAPLHLHLARHALADLFLDTQPYNAHATACDALWAGLPVVTLRGSAYAGRVAASLVTAAGLPELIAETPDAYESLALALARDPERLHALKQRLADGRATAPLFDMTRFARDFESLIASLIR